MKNKTKRHLNLGLLFSLLPLLNTAFAEVPDFQTASRFPLTNLLEFDLSKENSYYKRGYTFSHDSRLFAFLQLGKEVSDSQYMGSTVRIWDTHTGQLKYQTTLPQHEDAHPHRTAPITFSHDNKVLFRSEGGQADMFIWPFTQSSQARHLCLMGNLNDIQRVIDISKNQQQFLISGVEYEAVCQLDDEKISYQKYNTQKLWGANTKILHNNRLLVIHNIRSNQEPLTGSGYPLTKSELSFIDFWDLNFSSEASFLLQKVDQKKGKFLVVEVFEDQLIINQWDFATQKWIGKQSFKGLQIRPKDSDQLDTYLSDTHMLIKYKKQLALFQRKGTQYSLIWSKKIPEVEGSGIRFSSDERYIFSGDLTFRYSDIVIISTQTGEVFNRYEAKQSKDTVIIAEPLVSDFPNQPLDADCPEMARSNLHSLISDQSQEIDGHVLAMSPDGKALAVCKGKELFLLRTENQAQ